MNKKQTKAEQRREQEKAALECELRLLAIGASGTSNIEDDPENGVGLYHTLGLEAWARFLEAIEANWAIGKVVGSDNLRRSPWVFEPRNLAKFESIQSATEFLYSAGAREGGEWTE